MKRIISCIVLIIQISFSMVGKNISDIKIGGLKFYDNNTNIEYRTSLTMFNTPQAGPKDSLILTYDFSLSSSFPIGHIVSCKNEEEEIFNSFVICDYQKNRIIFNLNLTFLNKKIALSFPQKLFNENKWYHSQISIYPKTGEVQFLVANKRKSIRFNPEQSSKLHTELNYIFGKCDNYLDIIPFAIKNLDYICDRTFINFPLNEKYGRDVHSSKGKIIGHVDNPNWLYYNHFKWEKVAEIDEKEITAIYQDTVRNAICIYSSSGFYTYNIINKSTDFEKHLQKDMFRVPKGGGFNYFYNDEKNELLMFKNNLDEKGVAIFNTKDKTLEYKGNPQTLERFHHNSVFPDKSRKSLYQIGGYSNFKYHNKLRKMDMDDYAFKEVTFSGDSITPRMYSSIGVDFNDNKEDVYLFGGFGNSSGKQEDGGKFLYDLYKFDLKTETIRKICDFNLTHMKKVPCRNLINGEDSLSFYTLCYSQYEPQSQIVLYRLDGQDQTITEVSDSIPFFSIAMSNQIHLFENKKMQKMFAVLQEFDDAYKNKIKIYQISTPLLTMAEDISITDISRSCRRLTTQVIWSIILAVFFSLTLFFYFRFVILPRQKKKKEQKRFNQELHNENKYPDTEEEQNNASIEEQHSRKNSIFLLGDFSVFDRDSNDITYLFSPKIRQLFMLIMMNSLRKSSNGVSSNEISSILWPEKELTKSKNIRAVTMKNLRDALSGIDGIMISNTSGKWTVEIDSSICHCDFIEIRTASEDIDTTRTYKYEELRPFIRKLRRGTLLKSEEYEWLDDFKSEFEENVLNIYTKLMKHAYEVGEYVLSYKISQVLLKIDPLNDKLMKVEINSLIYLGDSVKAMMKFRQFSINYYGAYEKNLLFDDYIESK